MQFKQGTEVFTAKGEEVGHIDRVVMDPQTKEVSHIVVRKGFFFTEDKVVPIDLIAAATEDRVVLREDAGDLQALPPFEETHYIPANEAELRASYPAGYAPPLYWYPPYGAAMWNPYTYPGYAELPYRTETERNIPEGTVALKEGAKVISADGEQVGKVEQVLTDAMADRATHLLISNGLLLKEKKLIPTLWISEVGEDEVHLTVGLRFLDQLREYQG